MAQDNTLPQVNLDTQEKQQLPLVNLDSSRFKPTPSESVASSRSAKAAEGLGPVLGKSFEDIHTDISSGDEEQFRREAAATLGTLTIQGNQEKIRDLAIQKGNDLTTEELRPLLNPAPINHNTIIERAYAHSRINALDNPTDDGFMSNAKHVVPSLVKDAMDRGSESSAKSQAIRTLYEDQQDLLKQQSWGGYLAHQTFNIATLGVDDEVRLRGLVPGVPAMAGPDLGSHLELSNRKLLDMPVDQMVQGYKAVLEKLNAIDPALGAQFLQAGLGYTLEEKFGTSINAPLQIGTVLSPATLGRMGKTAINAIDDLNHVRLGVKAATDSANIGLSPAEHLAAVGRAGDSGSKIASDSITREIAGQADPTKDAISQLTTNFRTDQEAIDKNPGRFGQEIANRIKDKMYTRVYNIFDRIAAVKKVDRLNEVLATKKATDLLKDEIKDNWKGPADSIADIRPPMFEPLSNTWWSGLKMVRETGEFFQSPMEAYLWGKQNGVLTRVPKEAVTAIDKKVADLQDFVKNTPLPEDDVHGLNMWHAKETELAQALKEQEDLKLRGNHGYGILEQQGTGFYINKLTPIDETSPLVKSLMAKDWDDRINFKWVNAAIGWLRTPEETLSKAENAQRKIATHGPNVLIKSFTAAAKDVTKGIPRKYWNDFGQVLDYARKVDDENGLRGAFFKSPQDLEDHYQRTFSRLPTKGEVQAYFAFVRNVELDRVMRVIQVYKNKSIAGAEQHRVVLKNTDGTPLYSPFFDAVRQKEFPGGEHTVAIMGGKPGEENVFLANSPYRMSAAGKRLMEQVKTGEKTVLRIYDPESRPLQDFGDTIGNARVRYVITDRFESQPLAFDNQVARRGGGHFDFDYEHYIKQAKIRPERIGKVLKHWYEGDTTVMPIALRAMGTDVVKHMNQVRELIKAGDMNGAKAYNNAHLPIPWEDHKGWYNPKKNPITGEINPALLDKDEPLQVVPRGKNINEIDSSLADRYLKTFKDGTKQGSDARASVVQYTGPRDSHDLMSINDYGSKNNPLGSYEPAKMVDPLVTMNRATSRIINSTFIDDMKINSVQHWITQAREFLEAKPGEIEASPYRFFANPPIWKSGSNTEITRQLETARVQIQHFIGVPSKTETFLHSTAMKLADSLYDKGYSKAAMITASSLPYVRDPLAFMRGVTFHMKMGLFNIPQLFTQLTTFSNVMAIGGITHAPSVVMGTLLHQYSKLNGHPEIIDFLDNLASKFRLPGMSSYKPGDWKYIRDLEERTGFGVISNEHAFVSNPWGNQIFTGSGHKVLDWGESFFKVGAQNTRIASLHMAYKNFRELNPVGAISKAQETDILARAALLDHNMSRASNSYAHTGWLAPAFQFQAYSLRLFELMTGSRLTTVEKARLFATSSLLYGIPLGGLGLYGLPLGDYLKSKAQEHGIALGDSAVSNLLFDGGPAAIMGIITGEPYNISKWASKGIDPVGNALDGDHTMWDIFGGAAGSVLANEWALSSGWRQFGMSLMPGAEPYPLTLDDVISPLKEVTGFNMVDRELQTLHSGRWMSKRGTYITDITPAQSVFMSSTGLVPQRISDITLSEEAIKRHEELEKSTERDFISTMHKALRAEQDNNTDQADAFRTQAAALLERNGYPLDRRPTLMARASEDNMDLLSRVNTQRWLKNKDPRTREQFQTNYGRILQDNLDRERQQ